MEFLDNVGPIRNPDVAHVVARVRHLSLQMKLNDSWETFDIGPQRLLDENSDVDLSTKEYQEELLCWMIASHLLCLEPDDTRWVAIMEHGQRVALDLCNKLTIHTRRLEAACTAGHLVAAQDAGRNFLVVWQALAAYYDNRVE